MQDRNKNRFSLPVVAAITGVVVAAGGGAAWWAKSALEPVGVQPNPNPIVRDEVPTIPKPITQEKVVQICWLDPTDQSIELVSKTMTFQKSVKGDRVLATAFETLLDQPPEGSPYTTAIPKGTKLLGLKVDRKGIHLNLSQEFVSGGGSASMSSRLAQVVYTATSSNNGDKPTLKGTPSDNPIASQRVWINVEGKPLTNLGEEGIIVNQPMTRQDFQDNFTL